MQNDELKFFTIIKYILMMMKFLTFMEYILMMMKHYNYPDERLKLLLCGCAPLLSYQQGSQPFGA